MEGKFFRTWFVYGSDDDSRSLYTLDTLLFRSIFSKVGLTDHPLSLILSYVAFNMPITIMILLGFYYTLPREVEEAAVIDGLYR